MIVSLFASDGTSGKSGKHIGVGVLIVVAIGALVYSITSYGSGDTIGPVTEADGRATMRKLQCAKCGYEEEVTSAEYNDRMKERADPTQWLACPKCHENSVQRASTGKPFGGPVVDEAAVAADAPKPAESSDQPVEEAPAVPKVQTRTMTPGS